MKVTETCVCSVKTRGPLHVALPYTQAGPALRASLAPSHTPSGRGVPCALAMYREIALFMPHVYTYMPFTPCSVKIPRCLCSRRDWCSRQSFTNTVKAIARVLHLLLKDAVSRGAYGQHMCGEFSGSRHLAGIGVPMPLIMLLTRWSSNVVLRYIEDARRSCICREGQRFLQKCPASLRK